MPLTVPSSSRIDLVDAEAFADLGAGLSAASTRILSRTVRRGA